MSETSTKRKESEYIEAIAERAEREEDVPAYFTNRHVAKQRVNTDFPLELLRQIDTECQRIGVTRQAEIKMVCDERLRPALIGPEKN
ncbi:MAG: CopG family transcriptional regulator [Candidatus Tectomicrobia bacterium]|nr:CopG family transcriptional regulator [Candidatus Tectomicrobia bacterium]